MQLNYGEADKIAKLVSQIKFQADPNSNEPCGTALYRFSESDAEGTIFNLGSPSSIEIFGNNEGRAALRRLISSFDLPRQRINMDLWAIQISSASPAQLSEVMSQVQRQVDQTREAMQETYDFLSQPKLSDQAVDGMKRGNLFDTNEGKKLADLGFKHAIPCKSYQNEPCQDDPKFSLTQLLLRLSLAKDPVKNYNDKAIEICNFFASKENQKKFALYNQFEGRELEAYDIQRIFNDDPSRPFRRPFQGFMEDGLHQRFDANSRVAKCGDGAIRGKQAETELKNAERRSEAIAQFAKSYYEFRTNPSGYDPDELARTAGVVDGMVTPVVEAINQDIEAYFIRPTLLKIRQIVGRNRGVEYAEVGRNTIAGINGQTVQMSSGTTSSFDEPTPLRLNTWLNDAQEELANVNAILSLQQPATKAKPSTKDRAAIPATPASAATLGSLFPWLAAASSGPLPSVLSTLPLTNAIALFSALSKEEVKWQALSSGIDLSLTPKLMRDQTQAAIDVDLKIFDPATKPSGDPQPRRFFDSRNQKDTEGQPLSRISKSELKTKVYVNTMDLFALSSFNNQTTVTGRRWYVPLIGTIWEGAFGDIPVVGGWFSFKRPPQNKQHQSIILTNTLIVPSAMGMAAYSSSSSR
ncbi:MAG: hypothetical protein ACKOPT_15620 [Cyanobium sp.]